MPRATEPRRTVALDLGTARTRTLALSGHAIADRPSVVRHEAREVRPIRHGLVADPAACLRLVRTALQDSRHYDSWPPAQVLAGVPVAASAHDRRAVRTAVAQVAGCEVTLVEEPLAAAVGAGVDILDPHPCVILDVGAGIVEAAALGDGAVIDAAALQLSGTTTSGLPAYALETVVTMTAALTRRLPSRPRGLTVTGGGAHQELLIRRLRETLRLPITPAPQPQHATLRGLTRLSLQPALAGRAGL